MNHHSSLPSRQSLAAFLSRLKPLSHFDLNLEQYPTPGNIAAEWLLLIHPYIFGKTVLDAGCGNGILGIGALMLGAKHVIFLDTNADAIATVRDNLKTIEELCDGSTEIVHSDFAAWRGRKVDTVIQNPPFGTKNKHIDKLFLEEAFQFADTVFSLHKTSTAKFVHAIAKDYHREIILETKFRFPLKKMHTFHERKSYDVDVTLWGFAKSSASGGFVDVSK